jgi:hypothetical protein
MTIEPNDKNGPADECDDPIVAEVHEIHRHLLEKHGGFEGYRRHIREMDAERLQHERDEAERRETADLGKPA